jgi:hypothetical protein
MEWYQFLMLIVGLYAMHRETYKESKDFHGRLCKLEEKYVQMMERFMQERK